jgi:hypothetical protein
MELVHFLRVASLCLLVLSALLDVFMLRWLQRPELQLVLGVLIVMILLVYDALTGIALAIALIVAFYRLHLDAIGVSFWETGPKYYDGGMVGLVQKYITPEHLENAQNNVVDKKNASIEMKGISGVYGEPVYGAQGMDVNMPGYAPALGGAVAF